MYRRLAFGLGLAICFTLPAFGQKDNPKKDPPKKEAPAKIQWIKDRGALQSAFTGGPNAKPLLLFINTRPKLLEKLKNLNDKAVVKYSQHFRCVFYEVNPRGDMPYQLMKSQGLGAYENKLSFFDLNKIDQTAQPTQADLMKPGGMKKWFKELKKGLIWQTKPSTKAKKLASAMRGILKRLGKLPKDGKKDPKKPTRKKNAQPEADQPKTDPAKKLFERGTTFEKSGEVYRAFKSFKSAARHKSEFGAKAADAVKRLQSDRKSAKIIAQQKMDEKAATWLSLGKSFQKNEKWKMAGKYFSRILKTYPKSKHAEEAQERLETVKEKLESDD